MDKISSEMIEADVAGLVMTWQPIETAPKNRRPILVYIPDERPKWQILTAYWDQCWWAIGTEFDTRIYGPTHWMPLPPEPGAPAAYPIPVNKTTSEERRRSIAQGVEAWVREQIKDEP